MGEIIHRLAPMSTAGYVLVVDDDAALRDLQRRGLEKAGLRVVEADNGRLAMDLIRTQVPSAIVLDLLMPEMDGFAVIAELRANDAWKSIPVIVVTARDISAADRATLNGNVQRILQKSGYSLDDLVVTVREAVVAGAGNRRTAAPTPASHS